MTKPNILSLSFEELETLLLSLGEAKYRTGQIFPQLHKGLMPAEMTNISKKLKAQLEDACDCYLPQVEIKLVSQIDGTVKYLFRLRDGNCIESVVMKYKHGNTICVSSQVGCRMGCKFCASTIGGKVRDLEAGEILGQVVAAQKDLGERIDNIVMMGIGEPMDNYDNTLKFLRNVNDERGICIGYRHISVSTCGHVDGIRKLAKEKLPITLSLSLHAHDDAQRSEIMPVNNRWGIDETLRACREYMDSTGRRISFEYTLIAGKNCTPSDAGALAARLNRALRGPAQSSLSPEHSSLSPEHSSGGACPIHVNLIPVNAVKETGLKPPDRAAIEAFASTLEKKGIRATVRRTLGPDINASCGQLRRQNRASQTEEQPEK